MSSSPLTSLSHAGPRRFLGRDDLDAVFLVNPSTEAITTLAQSVSGMNPILTSSSRGVGAGVDTPWCPSVENSAVAPAFWMKSRRFGAAGPGVWVMFNS